MPINFFYKSIILNFFKLFIRKLAPYSSTDNFVSNDFGFSRGTPVDRWYIHQFFKNNYKFISGDCLEFGELTYIKKYGVNVSQKFIFNYSDTTIISNNMIQGDLSKTFELPELNLDCIVCVNVLNFIYDVKAALVGLRRMLKQNGVVIITVAGPVAHISNYDMARWGDYWRFTDISISRLVNEAGFIVEDVKSYGNPLACVTQINGYSFEDLKVESLKPNHHDYQLVIGLVARKQEIKLKSKYYEG